MSPSLQPTLLPKLGIREGHLRCGSLDLHSFVLTRITSILISRFLLDLLQLGAESDAATGDSETDRTPTGILLTSQVPDQTSAFPSLLFEEQQLQVDEGLSLVADVQRVQEVPRDRRESQDA